jgi:DNA-directed RNA polymerase subunit RPC12/RpoP
VSPGIEAPIDPPDWSEEEEDTYACPVCDGPSDELGPLGNRIHYRCVNCGTDWSRQPTGVRKYIESEEESK